VALGDELGALFRVFDTDVSTCIGPFA
jgi:hypothetical protein